VEFRENSPFYQIRFDDGFHTITRSTTGTEPTDQADTIVAMLQPVLDTIDPSPGIRLVGVSGSNLAPVHRQLTLDEVAVGAPLPGAREAAMDEVRRRFGADAIGPASAVRAGRLRIVERGEQQWGPSFPES